MKVVFAVPSYTKAPCIEFQMASLATQVLLQKHGIETAWRYRGGDPYVHKCRNVLASEFIRDHKDADCLFFLDDDLGWQPEAALRAIQRPEDVIAGIYPKKMDEEPREWPVEMLFRDTGQPIERDGLYLAALVPTGFLRIKRYVLEACMPESGEYPELDKKHGSVTCWDFFRTGFIATEAGGKVGRWWGEDFFFSVMVRNLGYEIWVDPDILFTHSGQKSWMGTFREPLDKSIVEMAKKAA